MQHPKIGDILKAADASPQVLRFLSERRSNLAKVMVGDGDGPSEAQLMDILTLSARVPDHRKLAPYRFILFQGQARADFGACLEARDRKINPGHGRQHYDYESKRFLRAHTIICVISAPVICPKGTPEWEQVLTSGAVCHQMLLATRAMGFACQWLSEWYAYDAGIKQTLGLTESEQVAGFIYIGEASEPPKERARPNVIEKISKWSQHTR